MISFLIALCLQQVVGLPVPESKPLPLVDFEKICQELHLKSSASLVLVNYSAGESEFTSSGVVLDNQGHLIVPSRISMLEGNPENYLINVSRADGKIFSATIVSESPHYGLSLLHAPKLVGVAAKPVSKLRPLNPGSLAFTFSNFLGRLPSLNHSVVSSHVFQFKNCVLQPINTRLSSDDVAMVMNLDGELVGIIWPDIKATELQQDSMSFFVPIEIIYEIFSKLKTPWAAPRVLGILVDQHLLAARQGGNCCWRLSVSSVADGSVADQAGILPNDQLLKLNDKPLMSVMHLRQVLQDCPATVSCVVLRNNKKLTLSLSF